MTDWNWHYFVMTLPLAALGIGAGVAKLAERGGSGSRWGGYSGNGKR